MANSPSSDLIAGSGDVALLVDWENLKFSLAQRERRPNVTALRDAAERFGRIVYARAYADWQAPVHSGDPASLYMAGLEPVYVLTKRVVDGSGDIVIKNSVDVKLAADCIEASHQFPNVQTYIIVSGDHGFVHVINTLRPHGKRVVVIGVSWTTSAQLFDQADVVLYYDIDVEPLLGGADETGATAAPPPPAGASSRKAQVAKVPPALAAAAETGIKLIKGQGTSLDLDPRQVADVLELIMRISREYRSAHRDFSVSLLGQELQKRMNPGEFQRTGKGRARVLAQALEAHGFLKLVSRDFVDWIFLPDEPADLVAATTTLSFEGPRYDYTGFVFTDLPADRREKVIRAVNDEGNRPGTDWLTFKRVMSAIAPIVERDDVATKNLVNNMIAHGILRYLQSRQGRDPDTGATYEYKTISLDFQNPEVRHALKLG